MLSCSSMSCKKDSKKGFGFYKLINFFIMAVA